MAEAFPQSASSAMFEDAHGQGASQGSEPWEVESVDCEYDFDDDDLLDDFDPLLDGGLQAWEGCNLNASASRRLSSPFAASTRERCSSSPSGGA